MKLTLKIGGHAFPIPPNPELLKEYCTQLQQLASKGIAVTAVTGGGEATRMYLKAARKLGADENVCDQIGIETSRVHARLLISGLGSSAYPTVPTSLEELKLSTRGGGIVVLGGLTPGHSTTAVGALVAEAAKSDLYIIASDVDGIYDADPKRNKSARKLDEITTEQLLKMALSGDLHAGTYQLDPLAVKIIQRSRIPSRFIDGRMVRNIRRAAEGESIGTLIVSRGD